MTDKLYNGFRTGRTPGNHIVNNQSREMTTKEKLEQIFGEIKESEWVEYAKVNRLIDELAKERERAEKLVEALEYAKHILEINNCIYTSSMINQSLSEYKK